MTTFDNNNNNNHQIMNYYRNQSEPHHSASSSSSPNSSFSYFNIESNNNNTNRSNHKNNNVLLYSNNSKKKRKNRLLLSYFTTPTSTTTLSVVFMLMLMLMLFATNFRISNAEPALSNEQTAIGRNITLILNAIFSSGYDKRVRPYYAVSPVEVGVTMHIIGISSVSEVQMDFTSDFYFRQGWRDGRLAFKPRPGISALLVGAEVSDRIWVPDTFFANEKSAQFHMATTPNTFIRIRANGDVLRSIRLTVTSSCPMNLQYFPMDRQMCSIEVESYGYSMADIMYKWGIDGKGSVKISDLVELPQFKVKGFKQLQKVEALSTGNYSRLVCELEFVRSMGYYLIQIYIPASLIVIISWVSFWLHRNASPARVQLGVTTVLTMTTLMSSTNAALPKISYVKSIDVYLGTCFVMVFASLLEYATVGYMGKRIAMRKTRSQQVAKFAQAQHRASSVSAKNSNVEMGTGSERGGSVREGGAGGCGPPGQHPSIYFNEATIGHSPRPRNQIANAPEIRYRLISGQPEKGRPSVDYSKKKMSLAPAESDAEEGQAPQPPGGTGTPGTPPPALPLPGVKSQNTLFGVCPSDIDKYSRVVFPVCFLCFNLMYWIIYMHISEFLTGEVDE